MTTQHSAETDESTIPVALRRFLLMRLMEIGGLLLLAATALLAIALATWSVTDPSFNRALEGPVRNWLGRPGAVVSDELLTQLGLGVLAVIAVPVIWAGQLLSHVPLRALHRRIGWWLLLTLCGAAAVSLLPTPDGWPLSAGLGGNIGEIVSSAFSGLLEFAMKPLAARILAGVLLAGMAFHALLRAVDIAAEDIIAAAAVLGERNQDRVAAGLGSLGHWRMRLANLFTRGLSKARAPRRGQPPMNADRHSDTGNRPKVRRSTPAATIPVADPVGNEEDPDRPPVAPFAATGAEQDSPPSGLFRRLTAKILPVDEGEVGEPLPPAARREPRLVGVARAPSATARQPDTAAQEQDAVRVGQPLDDAYMPEELPEEDGFDQGPEHGEGMPAAAPAASTVKRKAAARTTRKKRIELPPLDILAVPDHSERPPEMSDAALEENARILEGVLEDFGVRGKIINVCPGPVVTLYELEPAPGIKSSRVIGLADDIARSMCAISARVAVVPGRNVIGIELPNTHRETVYLREMLESPSYLKTRNRLPIALGKNIAGEPVFADLARMPHLLIAGTTGSGKSVGINTFIMSLLYKMRPEQCRLIMIDPKMLELSVYEGIPHLLAPVVTDPKKAVVALKWAVREMEERYQKMARLGVRNLEGYNARVKEALKAGEVITRTVQTGFDPDTGEPVFEEKEMELEVLPYIVVIIDEMADLMMVAGKDIEGAVQRLAQMARAAGIHVIMATQRPSVDVITGTIKANFPTRISFQVTSKIDSRTILGEMGAEQLLGMGDMLYMAGGGRIVRLHGPFVSDEEVEEVVRFLKSQSAPDYVDAVTTEADDTPSGGGGGGGGAVGRSGDDLYDRAVQVVLRDKKVSTSYIQRRLQIGYNKAATLIERMEEEGLISAPNSKGRREILVGGDSAR